MADWPQSLKPISKFVARAREVQKLQPLVAYYCNYYALTQAINIRDTNDQAANRFVTGLLEKCETEKAQVGVDDGSHRGRVEEFALAVFDRADTEDREGNATKTTALSFYAAMCFLQVCTVFGPLTTDLQDRLRYAKWKASDISKALREGRKPVPGAPGEAEAIEKADREAADAQARQLEAAREAAHALGTDDAVGYEDVQTQNDNEHIIPPAPALREYETDLHEYQPGVEANDNYSSETTYPAEAPKYPSEDAPSPLQPRKVSDGAYTDDPYEYEAKPNYPRPPTPTLELPGQPTLPVVPPKPPKQYTTPAVIPDTDSVRSIPPSDTYDEPNDIALSLPMAGPRQVALSKATAALPPAAAAPVRNANYKPSVKQSAEAQRLAKYAASALDFQDVKTAVSNLEQALALLRGS